MKLWQKISTGLVAVGVATTVAVEKLDKYEDPAPKTALEQTLEVLPAKQRAEEKVKELGKADIQSFAKRGFDIQIRSIKEEGDILTVDVYVEKDGLPLDVNSPFHFRNPPIKVMTGKYHRELVEGEEKDVANFEVNKEEALKEIITQTIEVNLKQ